MTLDSKTIDVPMPQIYENPYVGPRTFTQREANRFFGREREARELLSLVIAERLVLFYAQSGAGKSSLLNARLIPQLKESGYLVLPTGRVGGELPEDISRVDNVYIFNLLLTLDQSPEHARGDLSRFAHMTLAEFMGGLRTPDGERYYYDDVLAQEVAGAEMPAGVDGQPPHVLILDQFEEIVTTHPARWREREAFFRQLDDAMRADPLLWVVLTLREDFVAGLDPYTRLVSGGMRTRFYMQRMGVRAALEAVRRPVEKTRPFAAGVAETLVDNLRQIRVHGQQQMQLGQFVEPVQLQVVCYQLWENLKDQPPRSITEHDLKAAGDVDTALGDFYEDALAAVLSDPALDVPERQLRNWFDTQLITEAGTRGTVYQGNEQTAGMPNQVIRRLQDQFLLRTEVRAGGTWVELIHDRFVGPIQQANRRQQTPLARDAEAWLAAGKARDRLYTGYQLERVQQQWEAEPQIFSPLERAFVEAAIQADERRKRRTRQLITAGSVLVILVLAALTAWSLWNQRRLREALDLAMWDGQALAQAKLEAEAQRANAVAARRTAEAQATTAEVARQEVSDLAGSLLAVLTAQAPTPTPPPATPTSSNTEISVAVATSTPTATPNATQTVEAVQALLARIQATQTAAPSATPSALEESLPALPVDTEGMSEAEVMVAQLWNRQGSVIVDIANRLALEPAVALAVVLAETASAGFGPDGRLLIRFELHIFYSEWGQSNQALFDQHFRFNSDQIWRDHMWRPASDADWQQVHVNQETEWQAFEFAYTLADTATLRSISMGAPQLMGFNHEAIGYASAQDMFEAFQQGEAEQIEGLFHFVEARGWLDSLRRGDFLAFAQGYNGPGQAEVYQALIQRYAEAFEDLWDRWIEPERSLPAATITPTSTASPTATSTATPLPTATPVPIAWPPDGEIVFASNRTNPLGDLFAIRPSDGSLRRITTDMGYEPNYTPADGGRIAFSAKPEQRVSIYTMLPDGSQARNLTGFEIDNWEPAFSRDGQYIAFVSSRNNLDWEVYVMRADGTEVTQLTNSDPARNTMPSWSSDGRRIAFVRFENDETSHIYTMNRDGTDVQQLTTVTAKNEYPNWSPDGSQIVFASDRTGNMDIFVMNADGSNVRNLTLSPEGENYPAWSVDGTWIAFSRHVGNFDIFVMTADGESVTNVTQSPEDERSPVWLP